MLSLKSTSGYIKTFTQNQGNFGKNDLFFSTISKTSCFYRAKGASPLPTSSLLFSTLTVSQVGTYHPSRSSGSFLAHNDDQLAPRDAPPHPKAALPLSAPNEIHIPVFLMLRRPPFLSFPPSPHTKSQFFLQHLSIRLQLSLRALPVSLFVRHSLQHSSTRTHALQFFKKKRLTS